VEQLEGRTLLALMSGAAAINYPVGSTMHQNVFVTDQNDHTLRVDSWNGTTWKWSDLSSPSVGVASAPAVINYQYQAPGGTLHENVFLIGRDGNLYVDSWNGTKWNWADLHTPAGGVLLTESSPAVINYQQNGGTLHENVFAIGTDGNLYVDSWNGSKWKWSDFGDPPSGVRIAGALAVTNYQAAGGALVENVFATGTDGNLYVDSWNGTKWAWVAEGNPGVGIGSSPSVMNYQASGGNLQENVFLVGLDGTLYNDHWNGSSWRWVTLGVPGLGVTANEIATPAVGNYQEAGGTLDQCVFVTGSDGKLYNDDYNGGGWTWSPLGVPDQGVSVYAIPAAVVNYQATSGTLDQQVYVVGSDPTPGQEDLYLDVCNGVGWKWADRGSP
jgi:hypothetical protein